MHYPLLYVTNQLEHSEIWYSCECCNDSTSKCIEGIYLLYSSYQ